MSALNRGELLDYLQEICAKESLHKQTYYAAVSYVDLALSRRNFGPENFQLLGITALFMAAKM